MENATRLPRKVGLDYADKLHKAINKLNRTLGAPTKNMKTSLSVLRCFP